MLHFLYSLNFIILLSGVLVFWRRDGEKRFTLSLVRSLALLPLLAGEYAYLSYHLDPLVIQAVLFSEGVFALVWFCMAYRIYKTTVSTAPEPGLFSLIEIVLTLVLAGIGIYSLFSPVVSRGGVLFLPFDLYGVIYFIALALVISMLFMAWRLEGFWRALPPVRRWEYKFLVTGSYLVCGAMVWATSYRLTYLRLVPDHLRLLGVLLAVGWLLILYAVARHRLLNRKMFVSRKVVYSFIAPFGFALYLLALGITSLIIRTFGVSFSFVIQWLLIALGLVAIGLFVFSGKLRRRVHFFISTHFYINKYEYRDEWLAFSRLLQNAFSEQEIVDALRQVLAESLYTRNLVIWLGNGTQAYRVVSALENPNREVDQKVLSADDIIVRYLQTHAYFYIEEKDQDSAWKDVLRQKKEFLNDLDLVLMVPLCIGEDLVGLVGLGPEFTGGRYGQDDFDLLMALGTQATSALLKARIAEQLSRAREMEVWDTLSTFVLHDVKNAASMLSLVRQNAREHIHKPEFQEDMLEAIDNALQRMAKVQEGLRSLKGEVSPQRQELELRGFLEDCCQRISKKLPTLKLETKMHNQVNLQVHTDPGILSRILENLFINSIEAGGEGTEIKVFARRDDSKHAIIEVVDNGPGVPKELLPNGLFEPFKTTKPNGSGIGLWQVKQLVASLKGTIMAENMMEKGAKFTLRLPLPDMG